ncbi:putative ran-binding protein [Operophtera brumata]|uniref:Putative ran-binding protein n=1 Tax=Operophtera brumata TaxID=104452 RepID=A0A0L7LDA2_OPEBR|nr:putative ran-binding protein [Operophtera brumata]
MYKNKKDIDKHVEKLLSKLSLKEFKSRAYSVARLYFEAGDYANCQKYVEQYLTQKDNNAAAYKLLGQSLQKMGQKDKALEQFRTSLDIDQTQTGTILDICELLADGDVAIEPGRAKYWLEKADAIFPRHPITFQLRERLVTMSDPDPEALVKLLIMELNARPKDPLLHARLLKHYLKMNRFKEAFEHSCNIEFSSNNFNNNYAWYEILDELLNHDIKNVDIWLYQLLLLTVRERFCVLSLTETPSLSSKSLLESVDLLHAYDQALERVARAGAAPGFAEFHASLLQHHRGQCSFHAATLLLKRAKKDLMSWPDATKSAAPLMLLAWQTVPLDSKVNWLRLAPEKQLNAVNRWYSEGTYRCSQSGHYLITNFQDRNQSLLDQISQCSSGSHWKEKLYEKVFTTKTYATKMKSSHFTSNAFSAPQLRLPRKIEVEAYDGDAQKEYGNSLHHYVWTLLNYKDYADFKCTLFDMLAPTVMSCGPETLNKLDIYAFLYSAALTTRQQQNNKVLYIHGEKPNVLPANITDLLCPLSQMKWWDCAYKFSQNVLGTELTDIRATLSRGIEVIRCIDNHGLDPELLCILGRIFSDRAKVTKSVEEKNFIETRAELYYRSAIPLLEKLKCKMMIKISDKRLFDYTHKEIGTKELNLLIEESKLFVAGKHINDNEYEKAIEMLANVKSQQAYYYLAQAYKKVAFEESNTSTDGCHPKYGTMLSKAKTYAYKALDLLKDRETNKNLPLYSDTQELIEDIEMCINKIDPDLSRSINNIDGKYSSDENESYSYRTETKRTNSNIFRNNSSTPKASSNQNNTNYRTAIDSQILENTRVDQRHFERIETEIKNLQKRDTTITDFMDQTKNWFEENRNLGNKIINTINSNIQNTTDQFKQLKISVDQVKSQIDECRTECKDVVELKKQIAELKKEVNKIKKTSSEQTINESDLYNLDDDFRTNETTSNYGTQLPFTPQMFPAYNQRQPFPVAPNPYQMYNQTMYNLYNQYSQFAQTAVPGAQPLFDPARSQMNFPGVYPTPDQMFLDMAHLIPPSAAAAAAAVPAPAAVAPAAVAPSVTVPHSLPTVPTVPSAPIVSAPPLSTSVFTSKPASSTTEFKDTSQSLPVNVVITSSDPLPTAASTPAPVLSVTIPQKHIKTNQPHNYQIAMPTATETNVSSPPVFSFSMPENKNNPVSLSNWNKFQTFTGDNSPLFKGLHAGYTLFEDSVVDGPFAGASQNTSLNKSRTISEKSNTSVENYDPCPDFKPIVPLPAEVKVTTGEEDETAIFSSRAKLFRFVDKQWKERGLGEMKLLKHKTTGKVRVLMRREQVHKVCANHIITPEMEISPMKNETKAYIWVANDFAEESVVLEKFCIRFKTADIAKQFYEIFEKARQESETTSKKTEHKETHNKLESKITESATQSDSQPAASIFSQGKTVIGGFTFSSTPIFKPVETETKIKEKNADPEPNKTNVFSNLTFKTGAATPFSNLLNTTVIPITTTSNVQSNQESNKSKLNTSDTVDEFEPTAEFKPVIDLPALVEQKTGEEDEIALFESRAKLLRYDSITKEWKERGLGIIKLLMHKDNNQKVRLLMRREQIMKVCCNHALTKEMSFQKMPNVDKAVTWCAKDFSEGELVAETFCLRFKTVQLCDDLLIAIQKAQTKMKDDTKTAKDEKNASKQTTQTGFGDKFKAKTGSWYCQGCYTNNLETFAKCACCEQPKPQAAASEVDAPPEPPKSSNWGDKFKPKPGSWECKSCLVRNEASIENCNACNSPKDPTSKKPTSTTATNLKMSFSFGIPQQAATDVQNLSTKPEITPKTVTPVVTGFGDKFKPKEGSWECKQCFVRNAGGSENCCACNSPQDPNAPKKSTSIFETTTAPSVKFRFGIAPIPTNEEKPKPDSIFAGTGASKFSFGIPSISSTGSEGERSQKPTAIIYDAPKMPTKTDGPIFSLKTNEEGKMTSEPEEAPNTFAAGKESGFGFVFKTTASKSPYKQGDESDGEELVKEEDCSAHFNPIIPLPDKVSHCE